MPPRKSPLLENLGYVTNYYLIPALIGTTGAAYVAKYHGGVKCQYSFLAVLPKQENNNIRQGEKKFKKKTDPKKRHSEHSREQPDLIDLIFVISLLAGISTVAETVPTFAVSWFRPGPHFYLDSQLLLCVLSLSLSLSSIHLSFILSLSVLIYTPLPTNSHARSERARGAKTKENLPAEMLTLAYVLCGI
jgi:hypothetical protein